MRQSPQQGDNRTGIVASGGFGEEMLAATEEFRPSSQGSAQAIADVRVAYVEEAEGLGETPAPTSLKDKAKAAVNAVTTGGQPTLLMDKLGERLGFEHGGRACTRPCCRSTRPMGPSRAGRAWTIWSTS